MNIKLEIDCIYDQNVDLKKIRKLSNIKLWKLYKEMRNKSKNLLINKSIFNNYLPYDEWEASEEIQSNK